MRFLLISFLLVSIATTNVYSYNLAYESKDDTLRALAKLKKRVNRKPKILLAIGVIGISLSLISKDNSNTNSTTLEVLGGGGAGVFTVGLIDLISNNRMIKKAKSNYERGIPLPTKIKRLFKSQDFVP